MNVVEKALEWSLDPKLFWQEVFHEDPYPYQLDLLKKVLFEGKNRIMVCSAGGVGKTKTLAALGLLLAFTKDVLEKKQYRVIIVSGSKEQSRTLYEFMRQAIKDNQYIASQVEGEPLKTNTVFKNRSFIQALPRSFKAIYGKHADLVLVDEAVEAGDFVITDAYRIIVESPESIIVLSSTPHDYVSLFVEMWEDRKKYSDEMWTRLHWSADECPRITKERLDEIKSGISQAKWEIYYLGKPYPLVGTMIPIEKIKKCSKGYPIFTYQKDKGKIIIGIDWGHFPSPTVVIMVQIINGEYYVLSIRSFKKMKFTEVYDYVETLSKNYPIYRIFTDSHNITANQGLQERKLPVFPITFKGEKPKMQSNLTVLFEQEKILIPEEFVILLWQLKKYRWDTKRDDDYVDSLMLACYPFQVEIKEEKLYFKVLKPERKRGYILEY